MRIKLASIIILVPLLPATGEVMDRVAVAVGNRAIKESQIHRDIRLTAFLNGTALDFSGPSKRKAADRLIDQTMIRAEMAKDSYPAPAEAEIDGVLDKIRQARFRSHPEYEQALKTYGITEPELKAHVAWQIQVLQFAGQRFGDRVNTAFFAWLDTSRKSSRIQFHDEVF
jgi:hypothetical protein